ncbi:MAG TPA: extracellular solute-binding protein [Thermomicrobiales bacterium]|nr:extracellular solute-binding protein [Thermomicrobiales bacterium]
MASRIDRRTLVSRSAATVAGAAVLAGSSPLLAGAQATPGPSPEASPAASPAAKAIDPAFAKAQDDLLAQLPLQGKKLRILSAVVGGKTPEEDELFAKEITRLTGIEVDLVHPTADYDQKLLADLAAGVQYDLIYTNQTTVQMLVGQEALTDLTDRIKGSAILTNPTVIPTDEWKMLDIDGKYYSAFQKFEGARMITLRQDWLDKLGLETPKTLDDLYTTMVALRDGDPNGDGSKPLGLGTAGTYDIQPFMSSQGILPGYVTVDGKKTIPYATEAAIPVYEWLAKVFKEGLYDPNFATATTADFRNLFMTNKLSMVTYWDTWVGLFNSQVHTADPNSPFQAAGIAAAEGPDGKVIISRGSPSVWTIPANAADPDTAFFFIEWWNTFPGITLGSLGIEGNDYTVENGVYKLTELGVQHGMDHGDPTPYNANWTNPIGTLPGLAEAQALSKQYGYLAVTDAKWDTDVTPILDEYIIKTIIGDFSPADGVAAMHDALLSAGLIDE